MTTLKKSNSGSALLFAVITAFVVSFTSVTLTALTLNQVRITENDIKRAIAIKRLKGGMLYARQEIDNGNPQPGNNRTITPDSDNPLEGMGISEIVIAWDVETNAHRITVRTTY